MEFRWGPGEVPLIRKLVVVLGGRVTGYRTCTLPQLTCFGALIAPTRSFHLLDNETTYTQCTHVDSVRKSLFPLSKRNHPFSTLSSIHWSVQYFTTFASLFIENTFFQDSNFDWKEERIKYIRFIIDLYKI